MNIIDSLAFDINKPATVSLLKTDNVNYLAIGLLEGQLLKKHQAQLPTLLTVLRGAIDFIMDDARVSLKQYDTFQIPLATTHEVKGLEQVNVFTLIQEK